MRINTTRSHRANCLLSLFTISVCCCCCSFKLIHQWRYDEFWHIAIYLYMHVYMLCDRWWCCTCTGWCTILCFNLILSCIQSTLSFTNTKRRLNTQSTRCQYAHDFNDEARRSFVFILFLVFLSSFLYSFLGWWSALTKIYSINKMSMCLCLCVLRLKSTLKR